EQNDDECDRQINNQTNIEFDAPPVENLDLPNDMNIDDFGEEFDDKDDGNLSGDEGLDDHDANNLDNEEDLPSNMDIDVPESDTIQESFMNDQDDDKSDSLVTETMIDEPDGINEMDNMDDIRPENEIEEQLEKNNFDPLTESNQKTVPISNDQMEIENTYGIDGQSGKITNTSEERSHKDSRVANENNNKYDDSPMNDIYPSNDGTNNDLDKNLSNQKERPNYNLKDVNPHRSLGDALERWRRRLEIIDDESSSSQLKQINDIQSNIDQKLNESQNFEFIKDDNVAHDLQVMSAATEDQLKTIDTIGDDHQTCNYESANEDKETDEVDEFVSIQNDKPIYDDSISINKEENSKEICISEQGIEHQIQY
ncbi:25621_t:CDS:2, partial [Gigaspora rosea]